MVWDLVLPCSLHYAGYFETCKCDVFFPMHVCTCFLAYGMVGKYSDRSCLHAGYLWLSFQKGENKIWMLVPS